MRPLGDLHASFLHAFAPVESSHDSRNHEKRFFQRVTRVKNPLHLLNAPFEPNLETTKSASGKRHPSEKRSTGEETIRPQQRSEAWGKEMKKVPFECTSLTSRSQHFFVANFSEFSHLNFQNMSPRFLQFSRRSLLKLDIFSEIRRCFVIFLY